MKDKWCKRCKKLKKVELFYRSSISLDGYLYWCKDCQNLSVKKCLAKKRSKVKQQLNPIRQAVYDKLHWAVESGKIKKEPCFLCGSSKKIEAHHLDYNFPLKVVWLCREHHNSVEYYKYLGKH